MKILDRPFTPEEIKEEAGDGCYVEACVKVTLGEIIDCDREGFLDMLGEKLVDNCCLMDISHTVCGMITENATQKLIIQVRGDVSEVIEMNREE